MFRTFSKKYGLNYQTIKIQQRNGGRTLGVCKQIIIFWDFILIIIGMCGKTLNQT